MTPTIEDNFEDILAKTQLGLNLSLSELSEQSGLSTQSIQAAKKGDFDEAVVSQLCPTLGLDYESMRRLHQKIYNPSVISPEDLLSFTTPFPLPSYPEMHVNSYLVFDYESKTAVAFDTGSDSTGMLAAIKKNALTLKAIFLTHTHGDHVRDLKRLKYNSGNPPCHVSSREAISEAKSIEPKSTFSFGNLSVTALETAGHSPGGMTYFIEGGSAPIAIVGDAIFAGSIGGASSHWKDALGQIKDQILSLPNDTVLCPGHGPLTTVAYEKAHNPLFPEFK